MTDGGGPGWRRGFGSPPEAGLRQLPKHRNDGQETRSCPTVRVRGGFGSTLPKQRNTQLLSGPTINGHTHDRWQQRSDHIFQQLPRAA